MKYRTVEFWHYRNADRVEVTITRGERGGRAPLKDHEYLKPTKASMKRLSQLLMFMEPESRPENVRVTVWTDGTALSAEATVSGPLYQSTSWADVADAMESWDEKRAAGASTTELLDDFFENLFRPPPLRNL